MRVPGPRGTMCEDPNLTFQLQPLCNHRKLFLLHLQRCGLFGQAIVPPVWGLCKREAHKGQRALHTSTPCMHTHMHRQLNQVRRDSLLPWLAVVCQPVVQYRRHPYLVVNLITMLKQSQPEF